MNRPALFLPLLLAACGTLPQPFLGNPGLNGARLAIPPAPVLMVPTPGNALLGDDAAPVYAQDLARELAAYDVPSVAGPAQKYSWRLAITAALNGNDVQPAYEVFGPDGKSYGKAQGTPVSAQGWAQGDPTTLNSAATSDAASLSKLMAQINARVQQSNPNSLENRTPRLYIGTVAGAPGDGDQSLPLDLARAIAGPDIQLAKTPDDADFSVACTVKASPAGNGQQTVELDWVVKDRNNRVNGQVTQIHALSSSDMVPYWGDVAAAAAQEAANGITSVIQNAVLKKTKAAP